MNRKGYAVGIIIIIGIMIIGFFFSGEPTVSVTNTRIGSINPDSFTIEYNLSLNNPYIISTPVQDITYTIQYAVNDTFYPLISGEQPGFMIHPGNQEVRIPIVAEIESINADDRSILSGGLLKLQIYGEVTTDLLGKRSIIPYSQNVTTTFPYNNIVMIK